MTVKLLALSLLPFLAGWLMNTGMLPFLGGIWLDLIATLTLAGWGYLAYRMMPHMKKPIKIIFVQNLVGLIALALLLYQLVILEHYWLNFVGIWTQLYFAPVFVLGVQLTNWTHSTAAAYCVSFLILAAFSGVGCWKYHRDQKPKAPYTPRKESLTVITLWLCVFALLLWGASMFCITNAVAEQYRVILSEASEAYHNFAARVSGLAPWYGYNLQQYDRSMTDKAYTIFHILDIQKTFPTEYILEDEEMFYRGDFPNILGDKWPELETVVQLYDAQDELIIGPGNYIFFPYITEENWAKGEDYHTDYAWIDIGKTPGNWQDDDYARFRTMYAGTRSLYDIELMRITGFLEDGKMTPVKLDYVTESHIRGAVEQLEPVESGIDESGAEYAKYEYTYRELEEKGLFQWQNQFDHLEDSEQPEGLVTVYAQAPRITMYEEDLPVRSPWNRREYANLWELLQDMPEDSRTLNRLYSNYSLTQVIRFDSYAAQNTAGETVYTLVTATVSYPLKEAVKHLGWVYVITFLIALFGVLMIRKGIRDHLTEPLADITSAMKDGFGRPFTPDYPPDWRETYELWNVYRNTQDTLRFRQNEIKRLEAKLDYAQKAEDSRRKMTSGIAHELKTPLAIVHSYAEGLKEHIAEDKRDQYLDTILSETDRMDGLVLQMLDLSRLEAGKVKLSRDQFSLSELTAAVLRKLEGLAKEKNLTVDYDPKEKCPVSADEGRITQAITNLAANAVQYAPPGSVIQVKVFQQWHKMIFTIENEAKAFTPEELEKVWETFYRTDKSRSGRGTGLGLAIVKSIIDLHGGKCGVENTETGVKFRFEL